MAEKLKSIPAAGLAGYHTQRPLMTMLAGGLALRNSTCHFRSDTNLFSPPAIAMIERLHALGCFHVLEPGHHNAVDTCWYSIEYVVHGPGSIGFDPSTVLSVQNVRRWRSAFILPSSDRNGISP
jgi:hypothetical protein